MPSVNIGWRCHSVIIYIPKSFCLFLTRRLGKFLCNEKNKVLWLYKPTSRFNKMSKNVPIISSNPLHCHRDSVKLFLLFSLPWQPPHWHLLSIYRAKPVDHEQVWLIRNYHSGMHSLFPSANTTVDLFYCLTNQLICPKGKHLTFILRLFRAQSEANVLPDYVPGY